MNNRLKLALARALVARHNRAKLEPTIYAAGKIWYAPIFRKLREQFNINSRWIDYSDDHRFVKTRKDILWQQCQHSVHFDKIFEQKIWLLSP